MERLKKTIEAVLFVAGDPIAIKDIANAMEEEKKEVLAAITMLADEYDKERRGVRLVIMDGMVQMASREEYAESVESVLAPVRRQTLSRSILETLSIVAYKQPITRTEIAQIRGVRCDYAVSVLIKRGLIEEVGRKDALGRPALYGTTELFLRDFNLENIAQLPTVESAVENEEVEEATVEENTEIAKSDKPETTEMEAVEA